MLGLPLLQHFTDYCAGHHHASDVCSNAKLRLDNDDSITHPLDHGLCIRRQGGERTGSRIRAQGVIEYLQPNPFRAGRRRFCWKGSRGVPGAPHLTYVLLDHVFVVQANTNASRSANLRCGAWYVHPAIVSVRPSPTETDEH